MTNSLNSSLLRKSAATAALLAATALGWAQTGEAAPAQAPAPVLGQVVSKTVRVAPDATVSTAVRCPDQYMATGGGIVTGTDDSLMAETDVVTADGRGWHARVVSLEDEDGETYSFKLRVMCVRGTVLPSADAQAGEARR